MGVGAGAVIGVGVFVGTGDEVGDGVDVGGGVGGSSVQARDARVRVVRSAVVMKVLGGIG